MSRDYGEALYVKAKAIMADPDALASAAMVTTKKCIHVLRNIPLTGGPKDLNYAMALILKGTILAKMQKKYRWAIKCHRKAANIVSEISGTRMNIDTLIDNIVGECEKFIEIAELQTGEPLDLDDLSEEEDADFFEDNKGGLTILLVTKPIL